MYKFLGVFAEFRRTRPMKLTVQASLCSTASVIPELIKVTPSCVSISDSFDLSTATKQSTSNPLVPLILFFLFFFVHSVHFYPLPLPR